MGCISVSIKRVCTKMSSLAKRVGGVFADASMNAIGSASLERDAPIRGALSFVPWDTNVCFDRSGAVFAWSSLVCTPGIIPVPPTPPEPEPYLEIRPEYIWVYPDLESFNEVFSNVTWTIL